LLVNDVPISDKTTHISVFYKTASNKLSNLSHALIEAQPLTESITRFNP